MGFLTDEATKWESMPRRRKVWNLQTVKDHFLPPFLQARKCVISMGVTVWWISFTNFLSTPNLFFFCVWKKILHVSDTSFFISQSDHLVSDLGEQGEYLSNAFLQVVHQFFTQSFSFIPVAVYIRHYRKESPVSSIKVQKKKLIW